MACYHMEGVFLNDGGLVALGVWRRSALVVGLPFSRSFILCFSFRLARLPSLVV